MKSQNSRTLLLFIKHYAVEIRDTIKYQVIDQLYKNTDLLKLKHFSGAASTREALDIAAGVSRAAYAAGGAGSCSIDSLRDVAAQRDGIGRSVTLPGCVVGDGEGN